MFSPRCTLGNRRMEAPPEMVRWTFDQGPEIDDWVTTADVEDEFERDSPVDLQDCGGCVFMDLPTSRPEPWPATIADRRTSWQMS